MIEEEQHKKFELHKKDKINEFWSSRLVPYEDTSIEDLIDRMLRLGDIICLRCILFEDERDYIETHIIDDLSKIITELAKIQRMSEEKDGEKSC